MLASKRDPWNYVLTEGVQKTWATRLDFDQIVNLYSDYSLGESNRARADYISLKSFKSNFQRDITTPSKIEGLDWTFPTFTGWDSLLHKTISAIDYALNNSDFDFIARTNVSSFWNPTATRKMLSRLDADFKIGGSLRSHGGFSYIEGDAIMMSREFAELLVQNSKRLNYAVIDDVSIGQLCANVGVKLTNLPRPRIERLWDFHDTRFGPFKDIYKFRCKSQRDYDWNKQPRDVVIMKKLHKLLVNSGNY